jgi:lycopene cyclase domain-containing protein
MNPAYAYLLINVATIAVPLALSFDKKVAFRTKWKAFWPANIITLGFFVVWDVFFTKAGIWGFNDTYLVGFRMLGLPFEEWLFFIAVPYACVFLYETFRCYIPNQPFQRWALPVIIATAVLSALLVAVYPERLYTSLTAFFTLIGALSLLKLNRSWVGWFAFSYLIILIPFTIANGLLTGLEFWTYPFLNEEVDAIRDQIVWYNNNHNLKIRLFSIPIDDMLYGYLLIGMNVALYEFFLRRHQMR